MATAIKCDRCGKLEEGSGVAIMDNSKFSEKRICNSCHDSFKEWWNSGKEGKEERQGCPSC